MHLIYYVHHHYAFTYAQSLIHVALIHGVNGRASQPQLGATGNATRMCWARCVNPSVARARARARLGLGFKFDGLGLSPRLTRAEGAATT